MMFPTFANSFVLKLLHFPAQEISNPLNISLNISQNTPNRAHSISVFQGVLVALTLNCSIPHSKLRQAQPNRAHSTSIFYGLSEILAPDCYIPYSKTRQPRSNRAYSTSIPWGWLQLLSVGYSNLHSKVFQTIIPQLKHLS